ncbi:MAG: GGDEF domain-containing protein, partial [Xanthomonadales bacterium]|nr:GGDEF domain-containing protein [Xanthomonadales bacterium]
MITFRTFIFLAFMIQAHEGLAQTQFAANDQGAVVQYKIGYFDTFPLSFRNQQSQADGLIVEILNEIARQEKFDIEWIYGNFSDLMEMMKNHQLDGMVSTAYSNQRAQFLEFSKNSFANVWGQVFLPATSNIESFFDLNGKDIALMDNDFNGQNFLKQCQQFEINCNVIYTESYDEAFKLLSEQKVDAAVSNNMVGASYLKNLNIIPSGIVFDPFKVYISAPKQRSHEFLSYYDKQMTIWRENPESFYFKTRQKWTQIYTKPKIPLWFIYLILGLILLALTAFAAAILFKSQVKRRVAELSRGETQLNQMINILPHMIFANDNKGVLFLANDYAKVFFGIKDDSHCNLFDIVDNNPFFENFAPYIHSSTTRNVEMEVRDSDGHSYSMMMTKVPYSGSRDYEKAMVTIGIDVSQAKQYEEEIEYLAHHDPLTGLPNRLLLIDRLKSSLIRAQQFNHIGAILYLDLDNFKNINDSQGHKVGDKLLRKVAHTIRETLKPGETVARLGADEFIIEIPELDSSYELAEVQATKNEKKIINSLKKP